MGRYPYSREVARRSGSNFYYSFFFLPREKRNALISVYAFSRLVDDSVDEAAGNDEARGGIGLWRKRLSLCFNGSREVPEGSDLSHPLLPELSETIRRFGIPEKYFLDLLAGVEMDLARNRYEIFPELEIYCYHVAGAVGLVCNHLFGLQEDERARRYAVLLGTAFQLTNILRDVGSDAKRGRIYLPREELSRFGVAESDLLEGKVSPPFFEMMRFQAGRARDYFEKARQALPSKIRKKIVPAEIMAAFYEEILRKLIRERFPVYSRKVSLSRVEKARLVLRTVLRSFS